MGKIICTVEFIGMELPTFGSHKFCDGSSTGLIIKLCYTVEWVGTETKRWVVQKNSDCALMENQRGGNRASEGWH